MSPLELLEDGGGSDGASAGATGAAGGASAGAAGGAACGGVAAGGAVDVELADMLGNAGFSTWYSCHAPHTISSAPMTYRASESRPLMPRMPMYAN